MVPVVVRVAERFQGWVADMRKGPGPAFARELSETNTRRLRVLLPLLCAVHAFHIGFFWWQGTAVDAETWPWRVALIFAHAGTMVVTLILTAILFGAGRRRTLVFLGPATAALYLAHGAIVAGIDQIHSTNLNAFVGYALGVAVAGCLTPLTALVIYGANTAVFVAMLFATQASRDARMTVLPNAASIALLSVAVSLLMYATRRRDFQQRTTIDKQREALAELNRDLERRVGEQVAEIVRRAEEVDRLNKELQAQIRARSAELSTALAKLAREAEMVETAEQTDSVGYLKRGLLLCDRFVVDDLIGHGGMGTVYAGVDRSTGARVAIKVIQAHSAQHLDSLRRFVREAGTVATVTHPAVVRMVHVDISDEGMLFQVQELVSGDTLGCHLNDLPWEPKAAARFGSVLCEALAAAHARGVIHRDVKPNNIMLTEAAPGLKLLDFGISKLGRSDNDEANLEQGHTGIGVVLGTPGFMAPEQIHTGRHVTDRADVYAVGVVLFQMLTGKHPFDSIPPSQLLLKSVRAPVPDVRSADPTIPEVLAALVSACFNEAPSSRPSAAYLGAELGKFADEKGAPALQVLSRERARRVSAPPVVSTLITPKVAEGD
jgi:serine/threonine-protein kinase